jgi:hypothetical protein
LFLLKEFSLNRLSGLMLVDLDESAVNNLALKSSSDKYE